MKRIVVLCCLILLVSCAQVQKPFDVNPADLSNEKTLEKIALYYSKKPDSWTLLSDSFMVILEDRKKNYDNYRIFNEYEYRERPSSSRLVNLKTGESKTFKHFQVTTLKPNHKNILGILHHDLNGQSEDGAVLIFNDGRTEKLYSKGIHPVDTEEPCFNARVFSDLDFSYIGKPALGYKHMSWGHLDYNSQRILNKKDSSGRTWADWGIVNTCGVPIEVTSADGMTKLFLDPNTLAPIPSISLPSLNAVPAMPIKEYHKRFRAAKEKAVAALKPGMQQAQVKIQALAKEREAIRLAQIRAMKQKELEEKKKRAQQAASWAAKQKAKAAQSLSAKQESSAYSSCMAYAAENASNYYRAAVRAGNRPTDGSWSGTFEKIKARFESACNQYK